MDEAVVAEERAYWVKEVERRSSDLEVARRRGDPAFELAGLQLRLTEAEQRLTKM